MGKYSAKKKPRRIESLAGIAGDWRAVYPDGTVVTTSTLSPIVTPAIKDEAKPRMDCIPPGALLDMGRVFAFGAKKHGDGGLKAQPPWSEVYAKAMRHLVAWYGGEEKDSESGMSHLAHCMCNVAYLIEYARTNPSGDDRP